MFALPIITIPLDFNFSRPEQKLEKKDLDIAFSDLDRRIRRLQYRQERYGITTPIKALDASLSSVVNAWSKGCDFEDLSQYTDASDGDIVRGLRRAMNLLRQIKRAIPPDEFLQGKLENCIIRMNRGVVDAELQLRSA